MVLGGAEAGDQYPASRKAGLARYGIRNGRMKSDRLGTSYKILYQDIVFGFSNHRSKTALPNETRSTIQIRPAVRSGINSSRPIGEVKFPLSIHIRL
jgi:hypothetical protein